MGPCFVLVGTVRYGRHESSPKVKPKCLNLLIYSSPSVILGRIWFQPKTDSAPLIMMLVFDRDFNFRISFGFNGIVHLTHMG